MTPEYRALVRSKGYRTHCGCGKHLIHDLVVEQLKRKYGKEWKKYQTCAKRRKR